MKTYLRFDKTVVRYLRLHYLDTAGTRFARLPPPALECPTYSFARSLLVPNATKLNATLVTTTLYVFPSTNLFIKKIQNQKIQNQK